eukprot:CAMPEP_0194270346 /NCGR_PEP_ID=MMETSP0169-20130528/4343_1 /TAXON_ID=218684 /ORGANISM="Corethron pennatum, Strain L29A3" /LENGTH=296 /DNA_ID=CAMNT_0039012357 /DNA_START=189 /DNA_END=1079 /DNA_ORIENTATION=+
MIMFQRILALVTGCSLLVISEATVDSPVLKSFSIDIENDKGRQATEAPILTGAPTTTSAPSTYCESLPIRLFYFGFQDHIDNVINNYFKYYTAIYPEIAAPFQLAFDTIDAVRASSKGIMEEITGCPDTYLKTESPTVLPTKKKNKAGTKKLAKKVKTGETKSPKGKSKKGKTTAAPTITATPTFTPTFAPTEYAPEKVFLDMIFFATDLVYVMNGYNTLGGNKWMYDETGIPFREIGLTPGAFDTSVCGYKVLIDDAVLSHQEMTGTMDVAAEVAIEREEFLRGVRNATKLVDYC